MSASRLACASSSLGTAYTDCYSCSDGSVRLQATIAMQILVGMQDYTYFGNPMAFIRGT